MFSREKRKSATSGEDRLVPIEISRDLEGSENVARSSPPSFVEGSSRSGVGWRQAILSGTAHESDFEELCQLRREYEEGDSLARMEVAGDWIE